MQGAMEVYYVSFLPVCLQAFWSRSFGCTLERYITVDAMCRLLKRYAEADADAPDFLKSGELDRVGNKVLHCQLSHIG
jgi:hypothetical protein